MGAEEPAAETAEVEPEPETMVSFLPLSRGGKGGKRASVWVILLTFHL